MKLVSLVPSATEIVYALGLGDRLVGRSHSCDHPAEARRLPALTRSRVDPAWPAETIDAEVRRLARDAVSPYDLDEQALAALDPDVVVTQGACAVCAVSHGQVRAWSQTFRSRAQVVSLAPARLDDVLDDVVRVADACGVGARGRALRDELRGRLARVGEPPPRPRPGVVVLEWLEPPMLAGHWVPDLVAAAGGRPLGIAPGAASSCVGWEELGILRADAVVVSPCGFDLARTQTEWQRLAHRIAPLAPRVLLLDGAAWLSRPGPRLVEAAAALGAWLAGAPVPDPQPASRPSSAHERA